MTLMDYALNDFASHAVEKYKYISIGKSAATPSSTSLTTLVDESTALRTAVTGSIVTVNSTNPTYPDAAQFTVIIQNTTGSSVSSYEAGLQTATYGGTGDKLGSRQTYTEWVIANGETVGIIWKIVPSRG